MSVPSINLSKRVETVSINLKKQNIETIAANIGLCLDISGSFKWAYQRKNGVENSSTVQQIVDRFFAMAFRMDPDKVLDVWLFNNGQKKIAQMEESDYGTYVESKLKKNSIGGGTSYAPILSVVNEFYFPGALTPVRPSFPGSEEPAKKTGFFGKLFGKKDESVALVDAAAVVVADEANNPGGGPVLVLFITDGENDDRGETQRVFEQARKSGVYIQCLGVGDIRNFGFLQEMADKFGNVGFTNVTDIGKMSDEDLYEMVINSEFASWAKPFIK